MEWKRLGFSTEKIKVLEEFCTKPIKTFIQDGKTSKQQDIWQDQALLLQCLTITLEDAGHKYKFWPFLKFLEEGPSVLSNKFHDHLLLTIIRQDNADLLQEVLDHYETKPEHYQKYLDHMKINSSVLKKACKKGNCDMIKILVKDGCRLRVSRPSEKLTELGCTQKIFPTFFNGEKYVG